MALSYKNQHLLVQALQKGIIDHCNNTMKNPKLKIDGLICLRIGSEERTLIVKLDDAGLAPNPPPQPPLAQPQQEFIVHLSDPEDSEQFDGEMETIRPPPPVSKNSKRRITPNKRFSPTVKVPKRIKLEAAQDAPREVECTPCQLKYSKFEAFRDHNLNVHAMHTCRACYGVFVQEDLMAHMRKGCSYNPHQETPDVEMEVGLGKPKIKSKPKTCGICNMIMFGINKILTHMQRFHHPRHIYTCQPCMKFYPNLQTFTRHRQAMHSDVDEVCCTDCQLFFEQREFTKHKKQCLQPDENDDDSAQQGTCVVQPQQPNEQTFIDQIFNPDVVRAAEQIEISTSAERSPFTPGRANMSSVQANANVIYSCTACESVFSSSGNYCMHQSLTHQRFACGVCFQTFPEKALLVKHNMNHVKEKKFLCTICGKCYASKYDWKHHIQARHPKQSQALLN